MYRTHVFIGFAAVALLIIAAHSVTAAPPSTMSYQGLLTDDTGVPLPNGSYDLSFSLWSDPIGGNSLWSELQLGVPVQDGLFEVELGSIAPFALDFQDPYHLEVALGNDPALAPRVRLTAAPYALLSQGVADGAVTGAGIADGSVVRGVNGLTDAVDLVAGPNVTIAPSGNSLVISAVATAGGDWVISGDDLIAAGPGNVGVGESTAGQLLDPLARLHVANLGGALDPAAMNQDAMVVSAQDAHLGLYSTDMGVAGSALSFTELVGGSFNDKWTMFRETANSESGLRFSYGTSANYFSNPVVMYLSKLGTVGIGTTSTSHTLNLNGTANFDVGTSADWRFEASGNGLDPVLRTPLHEYGELGGGLANALWRVSAQRFYASATVGYLTYSDREIKEDIRPLEDALTLVTRLRGVRYAIKEEHFYRPGKRGGEFERTNQLGLIAQEVEEVLPSVVVTDEETGFKAVGYVAMIPVLIEAIKEQQRLIDRLETRLAALEKGGR